MARPQRKRLICKMPDFESFSPDKIRSPKVICLSLDEYEVLRLCDYERYTHEECAKKMDISRTTVTEIYDNARFKIASTLVNGLRLKIEGGNYAICNEKEVFSDLIPEKKGTRIAMPCSSGRIFEHFGCSEEFFIMDIKDKEVVFKDIIKRGEIKPPLTVDFLRKRDVDIIVCDRIGENAILKAEASDIKVYKGRQKSVKDEIEVILKKLK